MGEFLAGLGSYEVGSAAADALGPHIAKANLESDSIHACRIGLLRKWQLTSVKRGGVQPDGIADRGLALLGVAVRLHGKKIIWTSARVVAMAPEIRPRVYIQLRVGNTTMGRVLDFSYIEGRPAAIRSWVVVDGKRTPGVYHLLQPELLTVSAPVGTWWYNGIIEER